MAKVKKMQVGGLVKKGIKMIGTKLSENAVKKPKISTKNIKDAITSAERKNLKEKMKVWDQELLKAESKKKMQAGGVVKTTKRVGPVDPNGAWTKVQERTIAGKKAPKVPLKKDKQLGATKMKKGGIIKKK
jgi:DNA primase catalytic subunit